MSYHINSSKPIITHSNTQKNRPELFGPIMLWATTLLAGILNLDTLGSVWHTQQALTWNELA